MRGKLRATDATLRVVARLSQGQGTWHYGYELLAETGLKSGSLYPILMRLAELGLLDAMWEKEPSLGRPPRHLYRLTPTGYRWLSEARSVRPARATGASPLLGMAPA